MPLKVFKGDLVNCNVDAIVNDSNVNLTMVEGVGRAIFHKAGDLNMKIACNRIGHCNVGHAVMTEPFNITNCKAIIHAVGPNYLNGKHNEEVNLRSVYKDVFRIALENNFTSIAFPLISANFNYPLKDCYDVAIDCFKEFLKENPDENIYLVFFKNFPEILREEEQNEISNYIQQKQEIDQNVLSTVGLIELLNQLTKEAKTELKQLAYLSNIPTSKLEQILKGELAPTKSEIISIGVALNMKKGEINGLLKLANLSFDLDKLKDGLICYCLDKNINDVYEINSVLFQYDQAPIGSEI